MALTPGTRLGAYEVLALLGSGGMGEVYRARDTKLNRDVALKVLPEHFARDPERLSRFQREAQVLASLNHPHIAAIYGLDESSDIRALVLELVEGPTLADRIAQGPMPLDELLPIARQVAEALIAAHGAGIIHRDLKPANIKLTRDGNGKVLDFGLAKAFVVDAAGIELSRAPTVMATDMRAGTILGTLAYMSPEQARGAAIDGRSDLFSLGLVLYEMVTGRLPIPGASLGQVLAERAATPIEPPSRIRQGVPLALNRSILRLLDADPGRRFQTATELRDVLVGLTVPIKRVGSRASGLAAALGVLALVAVGLWFVVRPPGTTSPASLQYTRLTNFPDSVHSPALSPEGKMLAFVRGREPFQFPAGEIYLKILPDGQPVALTHDGSSKMGPAFTPDASRIVFTVVNPAGAAGWRTFSVPVAGGSPTLFMPNAAGLRWIAPGQVMFSEMRKAPNMGVVTAGESRAQPRDIYIPASPQGMAHFSERSTDGKWVLIVEMGINQTWLPCRVVPFDGSSRGTRVGPPGAECTSATWSPDGRWMYFAAAVSNESHLWRQRFPDGPPEQLTFGTTQEHGVVVEPDGRSLITSLGGAQSVVWYHDESGERAVSVEGYAYRALVSPDGSKVFYLVRRAAKRSFSIGELWVAELATGRNERVLPDFLVRSYHVSRDGRFVVFDAFDEKDRSRVWLATTDRSQAPRRLTPDGSVDEQRPFFVASGDIYFMQEQSQDRLFLYRMKPDGSGRQKRSESITFLVNISPDEKWAALWEPGGHVTDALLFSLADGASRPLCNCSMGPILPDSPRVSWSGDGKTMFVGNGDPARPDGGTSLIPWRGAESIPAGAALSAADLPRLAGARHIPEMSVAPGPTATTYAFTRQAEQSNLYRVRLP